MRIGCKLPALLFLLLAAGPLAADESPTAYLLKFPAADRFCPPVAGYFEEVERTVSRAGYHTFRHQPNGGYGLPVQDTVDGKNLLHLGADVGWFRVGDAVYSVANGIVRVSQGGAAEDDRKTKAKGPAQLAWGNLVVVEHTLPDDRHATTIYGHLANERLVKVGDIVRAGQQLGTIGTTRVNGGYKPHLHFAVREGRMAEVGRKLMPIVIEGKQARLTIEKVEDDKLTLSGGDELPERFLLGNDQRVEFIQRDGKVEAPATVLIYMPPIDFLIVGYGLSTEGWLDPTAFLREHGAELAPAAFEAPQGRVRQRR